MHYYMTVPLRPELNYPNILKALNAMGYTGYVGAEYQPGTTTQSGLHWLADFKDLCR